MGMYTELNICFDLAKDTPKNVISILKYLIEETDINCALPKHDFFKCDRWKTIARGDSYYFQGLTKSSIKYDNILYTWKVNIRANLKNYDMEIEKFLGWIAPYIAEDGFLGYTRYEEFEDPTLIYRENGKMAIVQINLLKELL